MSAPTLEMAQALLEAQPFSVLLGARITRFDADGVRLELDVREDHLQQNGLVHGGVLSYAADNALTYAGATALGSEVLTGGFTIDYLQPAVGGRLVAEATVVHASRRKATCRCEVYTRTETTTHCATATGTIIAVSGTPAS